MGAFKKAEFWIVQLTIVVLLLMSNYQLYSYELKAAGYFNTGASHEIQNHSVIDIKNFEKHREGTLYRTWKMISLLMQFALMAFPIFWYVRSRDPNWTKAFKSMKFWAIQMSLIVLTIAAAIQSSNYGKASIKELEKASAFIGRDSHALELSRKHYELSQKIIRSTPSKVWMLITYTLGLCISLFPIIWLQQKWKREKIYRLQKLVN